MDERLNRDRFHQLEERFPLQEVRHVQLRALALLGTEQESGQLAEMLAFGEGFVSEVVLTSPPDHPAGVAHVQLPVVGGRGRRGRPASRSARAPETTCARS